jgi:hypothetical protein
MKLALQKTSHLPFFQKKLRQSKKERRTSTVIVWHQVDLTPLEIIFNKPHPSILLHVPDGTTRKVLILFLQEIKRDIIFRRAQLAEPRRREELQPRIQAHLLSVISKLQAFLEYQGVLNYTDAHGTLRTP